MENEFFKNEDLEDLFAQLGDSMDEVVLENDPEIQAAKRRYEEIIKKHKK